MVEWWSGGGVTSVIITNDTVPYCSVLQNTAIYWSVLEHHRWERDLITGCRLARLITVVLLAPCGFDAAGAFMVTTVRAKCKVRYKYFGKRISTTR